MPATQTQLDKAHANTLLGSIFEAFKTVFNRPQAPKPEDFLHILTPTFHFTSNGASCKNLYEYTNRLEKIKASFSKGEVKNPQILLVADNKVVVTYLVVVTSKEGKELDVNVMATATVDHGHFTEWTQVTHIQGTSIWE